MLGVTMVGGDTRRPSKTRVRPAAGSTVCENVSLMPSASNVGAIDAATVCLINAARRAAGLTPLVENTALGRAAVGHSADMVAANYFDHVGSDGRGIEQRVMAAGFKGSTTRLAENLAAATGSDATPAATVASWLASPAHRANILDPAYRQAGVGVIGGLPAIVGTTPGATYTADFA
ncbi:MAG TPA: CAP domain-containing protein [Solirubrobacteraceae bacterium]|nr:CAP domain-containing protein [Solirubrobacteraceae bacterium]